MENRECIAVSLWGEKQFRDWSSCLSLATADCLTAQGSGNEGPMDCRKRKGPHQKSHPQDLVQRTSGCQICTFLMPTAPLTRASRAPCRRRGNKNNGTHSAQLSLKLDMKAALMHHGPCLPTDRSAICHPIILLRHLAPHYNQVPNQTRSCALAIRQTMVVTLQNLSFTVCQESS
jgi:hypothetical protein